MAKEPNIDGLISLVPPLPAFGFISWGPSMFCWFRKLPAFGFISWHLQVRTFHLSES